MLFIYQSCACDAPCKVGEERLAEINLCTDELTSLYNTIDVVPTSHQLKQLKVKFKILFKAREGEGAGRKWWCKLEKLGNNQKPCSFLLRSSSRYELRFCFNLSSQMNREGSIL